MPIETREGEKTFLIIIAPDGTVRHSEARVETLAFDGERLLFRNPGAPQILAADALASVLPDASALLSQIADLQSKAGEQNQARVDAEAAKSAAEKDRDEKVAAAEASRDAGIAAEAAKVLALEARVAALTAVSDRSIHKAYLRAALASIDLLTEVDDAVQVAGAVKWELWANATTISQDDADVNAIAGALGIDLDAVFAAARAIRTARGG